MLSPVEEIKSRIDVVELVGSYVRLQKAGANFKALCPFHTERTASFNVSPARQIWHCFGCSKGGDIFQFVKEIEGMDFPEALKFLAERAGIVLKKEDPAIRSERNRLSALIEEATKFFESNLAIGPASQSAGGLPSGNQIALEYLRKRGLSYETIKEFRLGYAPDEWRALSSYLATKGFTAAEMEKAGLAIGRGQTPTHTQTNADHQRQSAFSQRTSASRYYDRFRGRIMFPIFDYQGRVIAFGGRIFPERENEAKYINSPETTLYQKNKVLYGLHAAKSNILKNGQAVVVEGYMDMIMAYQAGTKNVVACSGVAFGAEQIRLLSRLCNKLLFAFDTDLAGYAATDRGYITEQTSKPSEIITEKTIQRTSAVFANNMQVFVVFLKGFKDAADAALNNPQVWLDAVRNAVPFLEFCIDTILQKHDHKIDSDTITEFQNRVLPLIAVIDSKLEQAHWVTKMSKNLNIKEEIIWQILNDLQYSKKVSTISEFIKPPAKTRRDLLEERVLGMLASSPVLASQRLARINDALFAPDRLEILFHLRDKATLADPARAALGRIALEADMTTGSIADLNGEFAHCYLELEREHLKEHMGRLSVDIRRAEQGSSPNLPGLLAEFQKLSQQLSQLHSL